MTYLLALAVSLSEPTPRTVAAWEFTRVQEEWVTEASRGRGVSPLVERLGAARYADRERAGRVLGLLGPFGLPALARGRVSRDAEVRQRVAALESLAFRCRRCELNDGPLDSYGTHLDCPSCGGSGDVRLEFGGYTYAEDYGAVPKWKPRELFGAVPGS